MLDYLYIMLNYLLPLVIIIIIIDTFIKCHKCLGYRGASIRFWMIPELG